MQRRITLPLYLNVKPKPHDVQAIVSTAMRKASNIHNAIVAPEFTNMTTYNDGYKLTISLNISENISMIIGGYCGAVIKPICYRGKHYLHWECFYSYEVGFYVAFKEAEGALKNMKIAIREAKIQELKDEIIFIKYVE